MFGALVIDRDLPTLAHFIPGVMVWFQVVGGFALLGNVLFALLGWPRMRPADRARVSPLLRLFFVVANLVSLALYVAAGILALASIGREGGDRAASILLTSYETTMTLGGFFSVTAAGLPFLLRLPAHRFRRVFALAKLSFKEAVRRKILLAFAGGFLFFLFPTWFLLDTKPEDQVRTYVDLVFTIMTLVLVPAAALISAFSIPADVKNQTIHTVVTKPVERFEIIVGRFLGFLALMTLVLMAFTGVSLLYVLRTIRPEAAEESIKAREPLYGELSFENTGSEKGINVGREWDYRSYITMVHPSRPQQTAKWTFATVPSQLASRKQVRFEYTFDVYRTTKGQEGEDVRCTVRFETWRYEPGNDAKYFKERGEDLTPEKASALAEKYGFYEIQNLPVTDYHTQGFEVPQGLFVNAVGESSGNKGTAPALTVKIICTTPTQYVGMARYDLYARLDAATGTDYRGFSMNFVKSAFGLWLLLALVIGLSVVLSSKLSGVITLLVTGTLLGCGLVLPFIESVALGMNDGGGPAESGLRMFRREISGTRLDDSQSTTERVVAFSDKVFRFGIRRILYVFPNVEELFLSKYVGEGFAITWVQMALSLLQVFGYLLPWFVLGYYVIRWREIAGAT